MTTKFYVDENGVQLGGFGDGALPPDGAVEVPEPPNGWALWSNGTWLTQKAQQEALRQAAYASESDPLFFMSQRSEATLEEWQAKVAEIKARFPYPSE
jgi:hypothetical protein